MPGHTRQNRFWACPTCALHYEDKKTINVAHVPRPRGASPPPPGAPPPNSVRPPDQPGLVTHQLEAFEDTSVAAGVDATVDAPPGLVTQQLTHHLAWLTQQLQHELSYGQAEVIEELKAEVDNQAEVIGELKADQLKLQIEVDELKAIVNQLKLQVEQLQVAGPAPVQAQIVQVEVLESC